jgi:hypothetical protein
MTDSAAYIACIPARSASKGFAGHTSPQRKQARPLAGAAGWCGRITHGVFVRQCRTNVLILEHLIPATVVTGVSFMQHRQIKRRVWEEM